MPQAAAVRNWTTIWAVRKAGATAAGLVLALAAPQAARAATDPAPVVAAERAFAADGLSLGIKDSFLKHAAPEAIVLNPEPQLAHAVFGAASASKTRLVWWPLWAGLAKSGDLGFTTGPYTVNGEPGAWYFTVWARQPDGGWKWLMDAGPPSDTAGAAPQGSAVAYARSSDRSAGSPAKAMAEVAKAESGLAVAAKSDARAAYLAVVADDGRIVGSKARPPVGRAELEAELATRSQAIAFSPLGGLASDAGDLAWTYGMAAWTTHGKARRGHYVRIWRNDARGWRLLFDELLLTPPND
jgi:ketosteroid isomerase-like protein